MVQDFKAYVVNHDNNQFKKAFKTLNTVQLPEGDVTIQVHYSSINYKDMLATQPQNKIIQKYPMVPGIDLAGTVIESSHPSFKENDKVLATGYDLGVSHFGGFSEIVRLNGDWLVHLPEDLTLEEAMIIGTAGFTAALSIQLLEDNKMMSTNGPVLVRGASGGVGSMAIMMLNAIGYKAIASTGQSEQTEKLLSLGAKDVIPRIECESPKALREMKWQAAIDPVGGSTVGELLKHIQSHGAVALSGNVSGAEFTSTVFPFILRGIRIIGVDSVNFPMKRRQHIWRRLAKDLKPKNLHEIKTIIPFSHIENAFDIIQSDNHFGRIVIDMGVNSSF
ncbi:acryloyl-CoA reductase [Staphylococcus felis]|uniref:acrylyl-CoA reductase family protein n=1 Tax=Staphylococcus felis TaxID=46127 RepID=UPI000E259108|nr:acryloyl-CoA reductase [Staphylococcus felis]REI08995.1 oxidoreductase [Staphylococcus felis]